MDHGSTILRTAAGGLGLLAGVAMLVAGAAGEARAQDCPRGDLDARYCDRDGDMLADPPSEAGEWLDPSTIVFTYTPVEDPALYARVWEEFMDHMAEITGREVAYFTVHSYAAMVEAMRAGRLHVGGFAAGSVPVAVNCAGFHPLAAMGLDGGISGYQMEIITHPESGIATMEDLAGRTLAFVSPTSNSGFRAPSALLEAEFGMVADQDYQTAFSGAHDNSILGVVNRDYDAAAIASTVMRRMIDRDVVSWDDIEIIYTSETFPSTGYGHVYNLHPELQEAVREAFLSFDWEGTALAEEFSSADSFVAVDYQTDWNVIRTIAAQVGDTFECR
jgi:phosphonate transport system substrate-binding protein